MSEAGSASGGLSVSVIGVGYLGTVHAACLAELGHSVVAVDVDQARVESLTLGTAPFFEPGLDDLLKRALATGRLKFTLDFEDVADCKVHFICVGTPQIEGGSGADLGYLWAAAESLAPHLAADCLVVGKSTVPVGTAQGLQRRLSELLDHGSTRVAWNPEFLREGHAIEDTMRPNRLVYGVSDVVRTRDADLLDAVYASLLRDGVPRIVTDLATAELVKTSANAFLATKISFINAISDLCERTGADVTALADALGLDPRIGRQFLGAGIGFGGGCLPKDIRGFAARAQELGANDIHHWLELVDAINLRRRRAVVEIAREVCGGSLQGVVIAVLGAAFKPNSDDIRDSAPLEIASQVSSLGGKPVVHDPRALGNARRRFPQLSYAESPEEACRGASMVLHLTEWSQYNSLDPIRLGRIVKERVLLDGRNTLDPNPWVDAGWDFIGLGRRRLVSPTMFAAP